MNKKITLHYFNARGLSEPIRYLLAYKKVDYVDRRFPHEEWPQIKPTIPGGKVPVLEVDGKMLTQSTAILVYLANEYGLAGKSSWEIAKLQEVDGIMKDISIPVVKWYYEQDESKKPQMLEDMCNKELPEGLKTLEHMAQLDQGNKFILGGDTPTWGDFQLAAFTERINGLLQHAGKQPTSQILTDHLNRIQALPGVKEHVATRPQTET